MSGGAGFIGSHLVKELAARGYTIRIIDNLSTGKLSNIDSELLNNGSVNFIKGDIRDSKLVDESLRNIDAVVHLAAQISVPFSIQNPQLNNEVNIGGTKNLLKYSVRNKIQKFIFASSCAVYGDPIYLPIDELHPPRPISPYAESKLSAEKETLGLKTNNIKSIVLRFFNVYGAKQGLNEYSGVITKFIDRIKQKLPLTIYGDGLQTRDFVYVKDVVNAIVIALENKTISKEVFNVGTGKAVTIDELAKTMLLLTNAKIEIIKEPPRQGDIKQSYANINKAKTLGFEPKFTLKKGLKELLNQNLLTSLSDG